MNQPVKNTFDTQNIFTVNDENFAAMAISIFNFQYEHNSVYRQYCEAIKIHPSKVRILTQIPFLPIRFFKSHKVVTTDFNPEAIFESSGTSKTINSRHFIRSTGIYEASFNQAFRLFYGDPAGWCILALLPSYLERNNSSLVMMADQLIRQSGHTRSGFYLNDLDRLRETLVELEQNQQRTLLMGVSFALLDFAEFYPIHLNYTTVMETGGMKGRREEMIREQLHATLCQSFGLNEVHSEYGMTELLSQAYSRGKGIFTCPPWMKVLLREEDDPFAILEANTQAVVNGAINIIDLANVYSCSFIAIEDAGKLYKDGSFEVLGRLDNTDIRGCSLLAL